MTAAHDDQDLSDILTKAGLKLVARPIKMYQVNLPDLIDDLDAALRCIQSKQYAVTEYQLEIILKNLRNVLEG